MKRILFSICCGCLLVSCGFDYTKSNIDSDNDSDSTTATGGDIDSHGDSSRATESAGDTETAMDTGSATMADSETGSVSESGSDTGSESGGDTAPVVNTDSNADSDSGETGDSDSDTLSGNCKDDCRELTWVHFEEGVFQMGSEDGDVNARPVHLVAVPAFDMLETEVTVAQYNDCVDDGACTARKDDAECTPNVFGFEHYPANCLSWDMAQAFCVWAEAELPTEAQWEFAARSGGRDNTWPWGNDAISCDRVVSNETADNCDNNGTLPVCSKTAGNTAQGLCDMSGNVSEWLLDYYLGTYDCDVVYVSGCPMSGGQTPLDGSAYDRVTNFWGIRGGHYFADENALTTTSRGGLWRQYQYDWIGTRCARWTDEQNEP